MSKHLDRLISEWKEHGLIIICVDFDDTLKPWKIATQQECDEVIELLIEAKKVGAYVVIHTACDSDRYDEIREYCSAKGLQINTINENPIDLQYGRYNKPYANIYIDDRAGLQESLTILQTAMNEIRAENFYKGMDEIA